MHNTRHAFLVVYLADPHGSAARHALSFSRVGGMAGGNSLTDK